MSAVYRSLAWFWQRLPGRFRQKLYPFYLETRHALQRIQAKEVPLSNLLMGDQSGVEAALIAEWLDDPLYASTPVTRSPHVRFLQQYLEMGDALLEPQHLHATDYYRLAVQVMDIVGTYFEAQTDEGLHQVARRFLDGFKGRPRQEHHTQSHPKAPIHVRPIRHSSCYQVIDGHHRLAILHMQGKKTVRVFVYRQPVLTPLQSLLFKVLWQRGRAELYQPVDAPEVQSWTLVRRCTDRFAKMQSFLAARELLPPATQDYVDLGSSYGWFVAQMSSLGYAAHGVERDPMALKVGQAVYGLRPDQLTRANLVRYLERPSRRFDVVSLFSVLHHFAMGRGGISAEELIRRVDAITGRVLFFDTGQNHEAWFRHQLPEWDVDYIEQWLRKHTTFDEFVRLGPDEDAVPPYAANYGRMLFACVRH